MYGEVEEPMNGEGNQLPAAEPRNVFGNRIARWSMLAVMFLAPFFVVPWTLPVGFGKETLVMALVAIALIGWISNFLSIGVLSYKKSFLNVAMLLFIAVTAVSAVLSMNTLTSIAGPDGTGEKLSSLLVAMLAAFLVASLFKKEDGTLVTFTIFASFMLTGLLTLLQLLGVRAFLFSFATGPDFNPIGTANNMALLYGMVFVFAVGILSHLKKVRHYGSFADGYFPWVVGGSAILMFINIIIVALPRTYAVNGVSFNSDFRLFWAALSISAIFLLGMSFRGMLPRQDGAIPQRGISFYGPLFLLIFAVMLYFLRSPLFGTTLVNLPLEVSPSHQATYQIAKKVLNEHMLFGSGPATFLFDYNLWRDPSINLTNFWAVKFLHGSSFALTLLATTGVLGAAVFVLFILSTMLAVFRNLLKRTEEENPILFGVVAAMVFTFVMWFLYSSNYTVNFLLFILLGVFSFIAARGGAERASVFDVSERSLIVASPAGLFVSSLAGIFLIIASVGAMYYGIQTYVAETHFTKGVAALNAGNLNDAEQYFARALAADQRNDRYYRNQAQVLFLRVRDALSVAVANPNQPLAADFSTQLGRAIDLAKKATEENSHDLQNWTMLGNIYETVIPFIPNADQFAINAYREGTRADPINPSAFLDGGRAGLAAIDLLQLRINQAREKTEADELDKQRGALLEGAVSDLETAIRLKPDYAPAHFLLAQVFVRKNDLAGAIRKLEDTKIVALADVGVRFQLGVLYYTGAKYDNAQAEFEAAVALSEAYSNARYFLGLIYDRKGDKASALAQFVRIAELNPGNQEVERIISNLKAGKTALAGIVPPNPAPEARRELPVK